MIWWVLQAAQVLLILSAASGQLTDCGCDDVGAVSNTCDGGTGQCPCKPGVGGTLCDACVPGFTDFGPQGCRSCDCDPIGAAKEECDAQGGCQCRPRVGGDQCDACSFGYRNFPRGCTPCPACFDRVAVLYNETLELYRQLLTQLNSTLEGLAGGAVDSALLVRVEEYRRKLEDLLERATNATMSEDTLTLEHQNLQATTVSLQSVVNQFLTNVTNAELAFGVLEGRLESSQSLYETLLMGVATLERTITQELQELLQEAQRLNQEIIDQVRQLEEVVSNSSRASSDLLLQAEDLLEQIVLTLENATLALTRLQDTIVLQNQARVTLELIEDSLVPLEELRDLVQEVLENATLLVPAASSEASRALEVVLNISRSLESGLDLESRRQEVMRLEDDASGVDTLINASSSLLDALQGNFSVLNASALQVLEESQGLNEEAQVLLNRSRLALLLANQSVVDGNAVITEARELLDRLQRAFATSQNLSQGLDDVIRYVEDAEAMSQAAEGEAEIAAEEIQEVESQVNTAVDLLSEVSEMLSETMLIANQVNQRADLILSNASALNSSTADLADEVDMAELEVERLDREVMDDREAIELVTCTANNTITLAEDVLQRIAIVDVILVNLTVELNQTQLLSAERLQEAVDMLRLLEERTAENQAQVDSLTAEIQRLQDSATELRERYIMLQQHRDLLQQILSNVESLNCRDQFA